MGPGRNFCSVKGTGVWKSESKRVPLGRARGCLGQINVHTNYRGRLNDKT